MSEQITATSFETCIEALGHVERRRLLLALLNDTSGGDRRAALDRLDSDTADGALKLSMHHVHFPKLEEAGFVEADYQQYTVTADPRFEEVRPLLELLDGNRNQLPDGWV